MPATPGRRLPTGRVCATLLVLIAGHGMAPQAQTPSQAEYIAFRVDDDRVIATVLTLQAELAQVRDGLSPPPVARYGFQHFAVPPEWRASTPFEVPSARRWTIHVSPGQVIDAVAEAVVGGYAGCQESVGVLLRASPEPARPLSASAARYFVASPVTVEGNAALSTASSSIGTRAAPSSAAWRASIEAALDDVLARELPRVRAEAAQGLARAAASTVDYHRSWARERLRVETALAAGAGTRVYDVQGFQLGPAAPVYFVRSEWLADGVQGFAASLWLRTEPRAEVLDTNVQPASWLRMFEFQGRVTRDQLGLVLNVIDRDRDGWGEVLFLRAGYEGFDVSLLEYSATGLVPTGVSYGGGC